MLKEEKETITEIEMEKVRRKYHKNCNVLLLKQSRIDGQERIELLLVEK